LVLFERPDSGWVDADESAVFLNPEKDPQRTAFRTFANNVIINDSLIITQDFYYANSNLNVPGKIYSYKTDLSSSTPIVIEPTIPYSYGYNFDGSGNIGLSSNRFFNDEIENKVVIFKLHNDGQHDSLTSINYSGINGSEFGSSIGIHGRNILIGSPSENNVLGENTGAIHAYQTDEPYVVRLYSTKEGSLGPNEQVPIFVQFSEAITVIGEPYLSLNLINRKDGKANYASGSDTDLLTFIYEVQPGDDSPVLDYASNCTIVDGTLVARTDGRGANPVLPPIGTENSVSGNSIISIEAGPPIVLFSSDKPKHNSIFDVAIDFNKPVTGLDIDDIQISNGSVTQLLGMGANYTINVSPASEGQVVLSLDQNAVTDEFALLNEASGDFTFVYDITPPTVTFLIANQLRSSSNILSVEFSVSEESVISADDLLVDNLSVVSLSKKGNDYSILFLIIADVTSTFQFPDGAFTDIAGNPNLLSTQHSVLFDQDGPEPTLNTETFSYINGPRTFTLSFGEEVVGFIASDISIPDGSVTLVGDGANYELTVEPSFNSQINLSIPAGVCTDLAGNPNKGSPFYRWIVDRIAPRSTYTLDGFENNMLEVNMQISESVNEVKPENFKTENIDNLEVTKLVNDTYHLSITPTGPGGISFFVKPNSIIDRAGNSLVNSEYSTLITGLEPQDEHPFELRWNRRNGQLTVTMSDRLDDGALISIYDLGGKLIQEANLSGETTSVQLREYSSAMFIVVLQIGNQLYSFKVLNKIGLK